MVMNSDYDINLINTSDCYLLHQFVRHEIITVTMTLYFYVALIPSIRISLINACESVLARSQATSFNVIAIFTIFTSRTAASSKLPLTIFTLLCS